MGRIEEEVKELHRKLYAVTEELAALKNLLGIEQNELKGTIYSAEPLEKEAIKKFEVQTEELLKKPVELVNLIDESLIGGVRISVGGKLIDASLKKRIEDLNLKLGNG